MSQNLCRGAVRVRQFRRTYIGALRAFLHGGCSDFLIVGGNDDAAEKAGRAGGPGGPSYHGAAAKWPHIFTRHTGGAAAGCDDGYALVRHQLRFSIRNHVVSSSG